MTGINKWGLAVAGVVTIAVVAGCSSSGKPSPNSGGSPSGGSSGGGSSTTSAKLGKIVYIPGLTGNPFYNTVSCGASAEAKTLGVGYSYQGASTFAVADQTNIVNAVVATKPGAIMISITDPTAMIGPLTAAKNAGIKMNGAQVVYGRGGLFDHFIENIAFQ